MGNSISIVETRALSQRHLATRADVWPRRRPGGSKAMRTASLAALVYAAMAGASLACIVCRDLPAKTLTDDLWTAETIAFARPSADNAFIYEATSVLRGEIDTPIPFLVNATARRQFDLDRDVAALILKTSEGDWDLRGLGGRELLLFVEDVLANEHVWTDEQNDPDRAQAFRALHAHDSLALRRIALTELSRVRYHELRKLNVALPADWIAGRLSDPAWFGWQPVMIHLLGLHSDPRAHDLIRAEAFAAGVVNKVPWMVALVEVDGRDAIEAVVAQAVDEGLSTDTTRAAVSAFAIHTEATPKLAPSLIPALRRLASEDPDLAAEAAWALMSIGNYSLAPNVSRLLSRGRVRNPASAFVLAYYVASARDVQIAERPEEAIADGDDAAEDQAH